ncbi:MAG: DUF2167 domain-containing protein [Mucilaginibacter polytrichastri]|nr:DUF2167 domain-containing protein [Mucilaginibacter polytrichastri]
MIKLFTSLLLLFACTGIVTAQQDPIDSIEASFKYEYGTIPLQNGIGSIVIPQGFKYLDAKQAEHVLTDIWNNPKAENATMGFILPEKQGVMDDNGYVFNIQYNEIGYVKDNDADDIDYSELLGELQKETEDGNAERIKAGYPAISLVGWASDPYYDKERNILHWAQELKFGSDSAHTLNYNVRVLGRKGVLVLNAISRMRDIGTVKADIPKVLNVVQFNEGYKYANFDPSVDNVAAWTIGSLVAGKLLAKVGFFALLLKFWKFILIGFVAIGGFFKKMFRRKDSDGAVEVAEAEPEMLPVAAVATDEPPAEQQQHPV